MYLDEEVPTALQSNWKVIKKNRILPKSVQSFTVKKSHKGIIIGKEGKS